MSEQALDLKRSLRSVRRHKIIVSICVVLGLLAGVGYAMLRPATLTSSALVALPPSTHNIATQVVIAASDPVLLRARQVIDPDMSLETLRAEIQVKSPTSNLLSVVAPGKTAAEAERTANAVAKSYVAYVRAPNSATGKVQAQLLEPATSASGTSMTDHLLILGGLGALVGLLAGIIIALALSRADRRLIERDQIANAIGVPVLASIPVGHPGDPGRWAGLLEHYEPSVVSAWQLRTALRYLGQADAVSANGSNGDGFSVTVLSLSSDRGALALGPQLAVFATSVGISTALVIGPQDEAGSNATAALHAACASAQPGASPVKIAVVDHEGRSPRQRGARLTVVVAVVDGQSPRVSHTLRTSAMVIGVSAGAATAEELARLAVSAAADGRQVDGILVADPDPADQTTGRVPQLARPARRIMPSRVTGAASETRR